MIQSQRPERPAYRAAGLAGVMQDDKVILLKIPGELLSQANTLVLLRGALPLVDEAGIHVCHGVDNPETYLYVAPASLATDNVDNDLNETLTRVRQRVSTVYPDAQATVLVAMQSINGVSAGHYAYWHYVVETDVLLPAESDFNDWYTQEHLPGLAAVPGTVRALRFCDLAGSPRYHALYLLENRETFGSDAWLQVRKTEWSSRVRPNFINTKRTMFKLPAASEGYQGL